MSWRVLSTDTDPYDQAKILGQNLYDRDDDLFDRGSTFYFATSDRTSSSGSWAALGASIRVRVPPYVTGGDFVKLLIQLRASTTQEARLVGIDSASTQTNGTTLSVDTSGSWSVQTLSLTVPALDSTWVSSIITFDVETKWGSGSPFDIKADRIALNLWFEEENAR